MEAGFEKTSRIEWVDVCRGLAILAVFIGHIQPADNVMSFVFRYHVPLFFFLSGFFYSRKKDLSVNKYISSLVKSILIPYFVFCVFLIVTTGNDINLLKTFILQALFGIRNQVGFADQLWFFTCLFTIQLLYYFFNKVFRKKLCFF